MRCFEIGTFTTEFLVEIYSKNNYQKVCKENWTDLDFKQEKMLLTSNQ
jgi:hypothetical protein